MTFVVIYDSSVLYGVVGDLLLRLAAHPTSAGPTFAGPAFRAQWTEEIAEECVKELCRQRPDLNPDTVQQRFARMGDGVDLVSDYEHLLSAIDLPNPRRRHVLAAAIRAGAQVIVTWRAVDFPDTTLMRCPGLEVLDPDIFVVNQTDYDSSVVWRACQDQAGALPSKPGIQKLLHLLEQSGLVRSVAMLRDFRSDY